jgi:apolipoprotein N-acyltransferase
VACFIAFPPVDAGFLAFLALVPLALYFRFSRAGPLAVASGAFGLAFFGALLSWIRLFGMAAYVALVIVQTLWLVGAFLAGRVLRDRLPEGWKVVAFPITVVVAEFARSNLPWGGFSWGGLGYTQHDNLSMLRLAPYTGVWGISFLVALVNSMMAEAIVVRRGRAVGWMAGAVALILLPGLLPVSTPQGKRASLAMVQGNVPENTLDPKADDEIVLQNHVSLTRTLEGRNLSLIVWAEGALERDPFKDRHFGDAISRTIEGTGVPLVAGATFDSARPGPRGVKNMTLMYRADGSLAGLYIKQRLVPFGEWVPLRRILQPVVPEISRIPVDLVKGSRSTVFTIPEGRFASVICYESTYPDLVRSFVRKGARMLVVSTNNSSYGRTPQSDQHLAFSQLRAAEQRMWVAHTAISGGSAVISPEGRITQATGLFEQAVITPTIRFATSVTPYARFGDWFPLAALISMVAALLLSGIQVFRRRALP